MIVIIVRHYICFEDKNHFYHQEVSLMKKFVVMCMIAMFISAGCVPPGQVKKQTAPGQVKKHTGYKVKIK